MVVLLLSSIDQNIKLLEKFDNLTTVTKVPEDESLKTMASPEQTADRKDSTKLSIADVLLKSITKDNTGPDPMMGKTSKLVNFSPSTIGNSKMTLLSSNNMIQELIPDYKKALKKEPERFYVIYKGPRSGVYTDWGITEKICQDDKVTCKKFRNEASARMSLATYSQEGTSKYIPLLHPKIQTMKEDHRDQRFVVPKEIQEEMEEVPITLEESEKSGRKQEQRVLKTSYPKDSILQIRRPRVYITSLKEQIHN